jgi:hypothetical protein
VRRLPPLLRRQRVPRLIWMYLGVTAAGLALIAVLLVWTLALTAREADLRQWMLRTDFPAFLTGARLIAEGHGAALYDPAAQAPVQQAITAPYRYARGLLPYNHLPFLAAILSPLAAAPLAWSYGVWLAATALALLTAIGLLGRELAQAARSPIEARWAPRALWALSLGFFPVYQSLLQAQTPPWGLLGFTLMIRYLRRERETMAGLALTLALVKPQLLIVPLLVLIYTRRWRTLGTFATAAAGLALLVTPLLGGFGWVGQYLGLLVNVAGATADTSIIQPPLMENLRGFFTLLATQIDPTVRLSGAAPWVGPLTVLASLLVLGALALAWRGRDAALSRRDPGGWDARWAATLLAALLVNPHGLPYELTLWLLAGALIWRAAREGGAPDPRLAAALLATGYVAGTLALLLVALWPGWPLHLGVVFMLAAVALLCRPRASAAAPAAVQGA